jgi:hypothetical protein
MSGMQDVASLGNQYQTLAERSKVLQSIVLKLKKEVQMNLFKVEYFPSYNLARFLILTTW